MSKLRLVAATAIAISVLTGCASAPAPASPEPSASPSASQGPFFIAAPLTGVQYEVGSANFPALGHPSVACKIDNSFDARPQFGLNRTDITFVEMVEGGLTRLVAIWHSDMPEAVGPVRSIRPMDPDILSPFGGVVCYSGGQLAFVRAIEAAPVFTASETSEQGNGTFKRSHDRPAPHNVIVNANLLAEQHNELRSPKAQFTYSIDQATASAATGTAVKQFTVSYPQATSGWKPNADGTAWLRTQDGAVHRDAATGKQVQATNVVVLTVKIDRSFADHKYGNVPKTIMVSSGTAWVFTAGKYIKAEWSKADATSPIILKDASGAVINLTPGNTWVELMPKAPEGKIVIK
ncbi:MAG: hypothetical protein RIQ31_515 [Actinomycetota bacterium]|jgi:hypothetical protein